MASSKFDEIQSREGRPMVEILTDLYKLHGEKRGAQSAVAKELGISQGTLSLWLKHLRLAQVTCLHEVHEGGEANPA